MLLFCTVSVSSCSREIEPEGNSKTAISFSSKVGKTKALVNDITDMDAFQVYGYYTDDEGVSQNTAFDGDVVACLDYAIENGIKQGIEKGIKQGMEKGIAQGIEQGKEQSKIEVAKNMKDDGVDFAKISQYTGIPVEEIIKL